MRSHSKLYNHIGHADFTLNEDAGGTKACKHVGSVMLNTLIACNQIANKLRL
jgi:hypothetical protein